MERRRDIVRAATDEVAGLLDGQSAHGPLTAIGRTVERTALGNMPEGRHHAVGTVVRCPARDRDMVHGIATAIRRENGAPTASLSGTR